MSIQVLVAIGFVLAVALYMGYLNQTAIPITFYKDVTREIPTVIVILASIFLGSLIVFMLNLAKASKDKIRQIKENVQHKKEKKILELYNSGVSYMLGRRNREAIQTFKKILEKGEEHVGSMLQLGILHRTEGNQQEAIQLHLRARALEPENLEVLYALEEDYEAAGLPAQALSLLEEIKAMDKESLLPLRRSRDILAREKHWDEAVEMQKELISRLKDKSSAAKEKELLSAFEYERGVALIQRREYEEAGAEFRRLVKGDRSFVPAYVRMGEANIEMGREGDAVKSWEDGYESTGHKVFLIRMEQLFARREEPSRIIQMYRKALQKSPDDPLLNYLIAMAYYKLEMIDEAQQAFKKLESLLPHLSLVHLYNASVLKRRGDIQKAMEEVEKFLKGDQIYVFEYKCSHCSAVLPQWTGLCPNCSRHNTYDICWSFGDGSGPPARVETPSEAQTTP